jgi:NAD dependent epimerase/dehydratase
MSWQNSKVLVTGAGGFIGSHLVSSLLAEGAEVRAMVRYNSRSSRGQLSDLGETPRERLTVAAGDVRDARFVREAVDGCDVVFHLAALIGIPYSYAAPGSYVETNITGTLNVLEAVREAGTPRMVATSTSEVYGTARYVPIDEEHPLQGQSPYSASKIGADKLVESYNLSFDVPVVTVRPFNTYGPRQSPRAILPSLILQALSGDSIRVGSLTPVRDLTYVSDTVAGFLAAATAKGVEGETINLGTGVAYSIAELVERVCEVAGRKPPVVVDEERIRPDSSEVMRLVAGNDKAREKLGWTAKVSLDEGLKLMVPWFRENPNYYDASVYNI